MSIGNLLIDTKYNPVFNPLSKWSLTFIFQCCSISPLAKSGWRNHLYCPLVKIPCSMQLVEENIML